MLEQTRILFQKSVYNKTGKWINLQVKHVKGYRKYYTNAKYNADYKISLIH